MPAQPTTARRGQDPSELYRLHARALERKVAARIHTSHQTVEDACSFAWVQLLTHDVSAENVLGWLLVVAAHQALRLHQRSLRTDSLPETEDGEAIELPDPADGIAARERLIDACALLDQARLTERQRRLVGMQAAGYSHKELSQQTGSSVNTVARQLLRAHRRIRHASQGAETRPGAGLPR
jgi:RNA polymerase sigma factor (sigma-70 family)